MHSENNELAKAGHELAKCLDSNTPLLDIAKLITRLATALDVTTLAVREATKQRDAEHNDVLVWEKTMFKVCGEDGAKSVAEKFASLEASRAALAAESAAQKNWRPNPHSASMFEAIEKAQQLMDEGMPESAMLEAFEILKMKRTPATDAFLAEVRAQGVEMFAAAQRELANKYPGSTSYAYRSDIAGVAAVFADHLRQGGAA